MSAVTPHLFTAPVHTIYSHHPTLHSSPSSRHSRELFFDLFYTQQISSILYCKRNSADFRPSASPESCFSSLRSAAQRMRSFAHRKE